MCTILTVVDFMYIILFILMVYTKYDRYKIVDRTVTK